ncbi:Os08g0446051 [Oryza sativa Japonica Group]|uniref:Os08g0446051 protein n=1 Tax=Oryza sativa subsp. japonica TaxID=39947 RepID=A0A0P0XGR9_ORYSJ|nr:Os08g0446051 [Oryza sativa Japonica Group]
MTTGSTGGVGETTTGSGSGDGRALLSLPHWPLPLPSLPQILQDHSRAVARMQQSDGECLDVNCLLHHQEKQYGGTRLVDGTTEE